MLDSVASQTAVKHGILVQSHPIQIIHNPEETMIKQDEDATYHHHPVTKVAFPSTCAHKNNPHYLLYQNQNICMYLCCVK